MILFKLVACNWAGHNRPEVQFKMSEKSSSEILQKGHNKDSKYFG